MKKKLLALLVVLAMVLSIVPAVHAEGSTMAVKVTPSASTAKVGDVIDYTVYATGDGVTALQFELRFPEGLEYVAGTAAVPGTLKTYLGWAATDWTESSMMWTGYNDLPSLFEDGTVILTFSAKVTAEGTFEPELFELLPFDENYEEFPPELTVGKVTVGGEEPTTEPSTEPSISETEPVAGSVMNVSVKASATEVAVGDTVDYTVYAVGQGVTALQFELRFPEGLEYVAGTAAVPGTLKTYLGWAATDWTESSMMWTGYNDLPSLFEDGTVILTFSAKVTAEGTFQPELFELLPFDENYEEFAAGLTVDAVTAAGAAECEHSFTNYVSNNDATCTEDGTETAKCDKCDETDTRTDADSALGHDMGEYVSDNNATCLEDGTKTSKCSRCDETKTVADEGSALGHIDENADEICDRCGADLACKHSFTQYVYNNDATCTENGTETAKCDKCDETDTREVADSAKGHSFTNYVSNDDATCTENGTETAKCDKCDETDTREDEGSAKGHDLKLVEATVTCTEAGNVAYYECSNCGELFADATGSVPTDKDAVKSDALGHIDEDGDKACDRCGYTEPTEPDTTLPEGSFMDVTVKASKTTAEIGDTIDYTVYAFGNDVTALQFELRFPAGLEYVANSAVVPEGLKAYLGWAATDWTESSMMWTGYNDLGSLFEDGTVILTFSAKVTGEGTLEPELFELLPFDLDYNEFPAGLTVDKVVVGTEPTEPSTEPTEPSTEPTEPSTEPTEPSTEPTEPSTEPTEPSTEPTEPSTEPTEPSTEPTEPSTEPTEPSTEPTEPSTEPTEPSTEPTEPSTTEPTTKPGTDGEEIPKTDNDSMVLNYFAVMMVAAFAVLFTVLLGKKKYMA